MAKRTPRTEADDQTTTAAAPARPSGGTGRARARRTAASDTFAARLEASDDRPADAISPDAESTSPVSQGPSAEDIRMRAYVRYVERGGGHGREFDDWVEAERELKSRQSTVESQSRELKAEGRKLKAES